MMRMGRLGVCLALAIMCGVHPALAQDSRDEALRRTIERTFDVLPLRDGIALHPKRPMNGIRSVEITRGTIAIDGQPATGAELRQALGADADQVLQLSYLGDPARRALFAPAAPAAPAAGAAPDVPPAPDPPAVSGAPTPPDLPTPPRRPRRPSFDRRHGDRVRIGGDITVEHDEVIGGDVVSVGGSVRVDGDVQGDVVSVGGNVTLGPDSVIEKNVTVVGGRLIREAGAEVRGKAQEVSVPGLEFGNWTWRRNPFGNWWSSMLGSAFAFVGTLARVAVLCLLAMLVVLFGRGYMERAGQVAVTSSLKAGAVGFLAQILFLPLLVITIVVLVMTIVGIPLLLLLPFAVLTLAVIGLVGFTGVAYQVGGRAVGRFGGPEHNPYAVTAIGVLLLMLPVLLSRLASLGGGALFPLAMVLGIAGGLIEYVAWTVGFGAMALTRVRRRGQSGVDVPPVPTA